MNDTVKKLLRETRLAMQALDEIADDALVPLGVTAREWALLDFLARGSAPVPLHAIPRATLATATEVDLALAALQRRRWLRVRAGKAEQRASGSSITVSRLGREVWRDIHASHQAVLDRLDAGLDPQSVLGAFATLRLMRRLLRPRPCPARQCNVREVAHNASGFQSGRKAAGALGPRRPMILCQQQLPGAK